MDNNQSKVAGPEIAFPVSVKSGHEDLEKFFEKAGYTFPENLKGFSASTVQKAYTQVLINLRKDIKSELSGNNSAIAKQPLEKLFHLYSHTPLEQPDLLGLVLNELLYFHKDYFSALAKILEAEEYNNAVIEFENKIINEVITRNTFNDALFDYAKTQVRSGSMEDGEYSFGYLIEHLQTPAQKMDYNAKIGDLYLDENFPEKALEYYSRSLELCQGRAYLSDKLVFLELVIDLSIQTKNYEKSSRFISELSKVTTEYPALTGEKFFAISSLFKINTLNEEKNFSFFGQSISEIAPFLYEYFIGKLSEQIDKLPAEIESSRPATGLKKLFNKNQASLNEQSCLNLLKSLKSLLYLNNQIFYLNKLKDFDHKISNDFIRVMLFKEIDDCKKGLKILDSILLTNAPYTIDSGILAFLNFYRAVLYNSSKDPDIAKEAYLKAYNLSDRFEEKLVYEFFMLNNQLDLWLKEAPSKSKNDFFQKLIDISHKRGTSTIKKNRLQPDKINDDHLLQGIISTIKRALIA